MPTTLRREDDELVLKLGGLSTEEFQASVQAAKSIPGRRWDADSKSWRYPFTPDNAMRLIHTIRVDADEGVLELVKQRAESIATELSARVPDDAKLALPWGYHLYPFQRAGIEAMAAWRHTLNCDERGLGKTVQALGAVQERYERDYAAGGHQNPQGLVIANRSVRRHWARHVESGPTVEGRPIWPDWDYPGEATILDAKTPEKRAAQLETRLDVTIVNWEQIRGADGPALRAIEWDFVIADAVNRAKNHTAQQTKALHKITAPFQIGLTGTPIWNTPDELWGPLRWLDEKTYSSYWGFYHTYVFYYEGYYGRVITGVKNADALRSALRTVLIRRTKKQKLRDLPDKLPPKVLELDLHPVQRRLYAEAEKELWLTVEQAVEEDPDLDRGRLGNIIERGDYRALELMIPNAAAKTVRLRQIISTPALFGGEDKSAKLDAMEELVFEDPAHQYVIFTHFRDTARIAAERIRRRSKNPDEAVWFHGDTPEADRDVAVQAFMAGEARVICTTIRAGGEGIDLYVADTAIFVERDWSPGANGEAEDRLHRIGQKNPVQIITLDAADTLDVSRVRPTNRMKELIVASVLGAE